MTTYEDYPPMTAAELRLEAELDDLSNYERMFDDPYDFPYEDNLTDVEADAMTLASAGMGTDEDYGYYGQEDYGFDGGWE